MVAAYKSADNIKFVGTKSGALSIKTKNKSVTLKSAKSSKKKKINVKWKKRSGVSGYQVMWSTTSNFKKNFLSTKVVAHLKLQKLSLPPRVKRIIMCVFVHIKRAAKNIRIILGAKRLKLRLNKNNCINLC